MAEEIEKDSCGILQLTPPLDCSCQELISSSMVSHHGWLRKRSLRNRLSLKIFNWPQMYVAVANKNLYYFQNETSRKPAGSVSLYGFNRIIRADKLREAIWAFKLEHIQTSIPSLYFSATSEKEMVKWMRLIKKEMLLANGKAESFTEDSQYGGSLSSDRSFNSSDYDFIETSIYEQPSGSSRPESTILYRECLIDTDDDTDDDDDIDKDSSAVSTSQMSSMLPSPTEPGGASGYSLQKKVPSEPAPNAEGEYWASVHFDGNKQEASDIINRIAEAGVYLLRKSEDGSNVLVVFSTIAKKYRIELKADGTHTLSPRNGPFFNSLEELLYHYYTHDIPGSNQKLVTPYKLHDQFNS